MASLFESDPRWGALIPPEVQTAIIEAAIQGSDVLRRFRRLPNMTGRQTIFNVRSGLPTAGAVRPISDATNNKKPVTTQKFDPRNMYAGEFAAIKLFNDADLADALSNGNDIIREDIPILSAQFGAAIDRAVIWGDPAFTPSEWSSVPSLWERADASGNIVEQTSAAATYQEIFGTDGVRDKIIMTGYMPNGVLSAVNMMGMLDGITDSSGRPIFVETLQGTYPYALRGFPLDFSRNGSWDIDKAYLLMADFDRLVYSIREDITWRITRDGTIEDGAGVSHNLAQENMTALIMHMRLGWQVLDPVTQMSNNPVPFAFYGPEVVPGP